MATESYQTQLERVQTAIAAVETKGQAIGVNGRRLDRGDLNVLYRREAKLRKLVSRGSDGTVRQVVPG